MSRSFNLFFNVTDFTVAVFISASKHPYSISSETDDSNLPHLNILYTSAFKLYYTKTTIKCLLFYTNYSIHHSHAVIHTVYRIKNLPPSTSDLNTVNFSLFIMVYFFCSPDIMLATNRISLFAQINTLFAAQYELIADGFTI